ncbi:hypothetical protein CWI42_030070 [Ordospora colligata]|uniref:Uncharacterized protein n=1 Tax=Ordospora colligata OC4 TaxID=1354746 RepID=A0A0B2ULH8_9MICR|nr:uncharacterized protein M896_031260 [Ordospora colligata OC4]KHN70139.1 hypothetical protein M896_031260 [Ordospora colligata OC4]TBU16521.1 hypothetical protein CWI41_031220 [Ordospora colligata]TBU16562.1 hypothetical protein CWI40_030140 [Ordospora colligata]TBU19135.1 hypothetical protein CWI42_030070 [Ordospora colligata]
MHYLGPWMGGRDKLNRLSKCNDQASGDIDDIFLEIGSNKIKITKSTSSETLKSASTLKHNLCDKDEISDEKTYFCTEKDGRKYHDGLPVYTIEELQLNNTGGDTEDCPIYCDCCT